MHLDEPWLGKATRGELTREDLEMTIRSHNNVVKQIDMTLRVVKKVA
jgi:hypothetical protein